MSSRPPPVLFETARQQAGFSVIELWLAYLGLGGLAMPPDIVAILSGELRAGRRDHDLLAQALNERFADMNLDHPVPYFAEVRA